MAGSSTFTASDGDAYERQMGRWSRLLAEPFLDFAGVAAGERLLDLGCGTGNLTRAALRRSELGAVRGLDFSQAYVEHAARHIRDPRVEFRVGDACAMPFADGEFERVLSLLMLHFVPQAERAVAEMRRVARAGATVAATLWDARGGFVSTRMFLDTAAVLDPRANEMRARHLTRPLTRPGALAAAWRAAGFVAVEQAALAIRQDFASFEDFWSPYMGGQGPGADYVGALDAAARDRLHEALRRAYLDGDADGPRSYAATAWAVKGRVPA